MKTRIFQMMQKPIFTTRTMPRLILLLLLILNFPAQSATLPTLSACASFAASDIFLARHGSDTSDCKASGTQLQTLLIEDAINNGTTAKASSSNAIFDALALKLDASGNALTASALAANGTNASSGNAILGVDASGNAEGPFDVWTEAENTAAAYAPLASPVFTGIVTLPSAASPTTDADGEIAVDLDAWGSGFDAIEVFNGTASAYVVATTASDTPSDGQVPKFNTGGSITWENDNSGAGGGSIDDLDDVILTSPTDGDILYLTAGDWINVPSGDMAFQSAASVNIDGGTGYFQTLEAESLYINQPGVFSIIDDDSDGDLFLAATDISLSDELTIDMNGNSATLTMAGSATISGTNTGDQTSVSGNAGTVTFADAGGDTTTFPALGTAATGSLAPATDAELTYNATTNLLTSGSFAGIGTSLTALDGENIQDDTIDDDSIDFADVTGADLTLTDAGAITSSGAIGGTNLNLTNATNQIVLDSDAANTMTLTMAALSGSRTITFPNATGTVNLTNNSTSMGNKEFLPTNFFGNGATGAGVIQINEDTDNGSNFASFTVGSLAANTVYTLPLDDGDAGEQLQSDGAGVLTWEPAGSGAPTDADYLVGTANGSLSAEIVVGTTPGGELGGTWASPTIDDSISIATLAATGNPGLALSNGATGPGSLTLKEDSDNGSNGVRLVGPASTADVDITFQATAGTVYSSGGTDVDVVDGGTGRSTGTTAYSLIATGTTATGAQQTLANGATTEILVGGGASALPVWTAATGSGSPVRATSPTITTPAAFTTGGTITLAENTSIALDPAGSADGKYSGITVTGTSGYTQAFGDVVYLDPTDSRWEAVDANSASGADGDGRGIIGMVVSTGTDGNPCTILLQGIIRADANFPSFTINNPIYASETAGDVTQTQPTTTDVVIRVLGFALTADEMYFNPSQDYITHT